MAEKDLSTQCLTCQICARFRRLEKIANFLRELFLLRFRELSLAGSLCSSDFRRRTRSSAGAGEQAPVHRFAALTPLWDATTASLAHPKTDLRFRDLFSGRLQTAAEPAI